MDFPPSWDSMRNSVPSGGLVHALCAFFLFPPPEAEPSAAPWLGGSLWAPKELGEPQVPLGTQDVLAPQPSCRRGLACSRCHLQHPCTPTQARPGADPHWAPCGQERTICHLIPGDQSGFKGSWMQPSLLFSCYFYAASLIAQSDIPISNSQFHIPVSPSGAAPPAGPFPAGTDQWPRHQLEIRTAPGMSQLQMSLLVLFPSWKDPSQQLWEWFANEDTPSASCTGRIKTGRS